MIVPKLALTLALLAAFVGLASAQSSAPEFKDEPCPANLRSIADDSDAEIRCGWLLTREQRQSRQNMRLVALFVLRILSPMNPGATPILHLAGGPGNAASDELRAWLGSSLAQEYDIILLDQRGSGRSRPTLDCPEVARPDMARPIRTCRQRLTRSGVDLSAYAVGATLTDIADLLTALDLDEINVYGQSYGTRLALRYAHHDPARTRTLILDGAYPPAASLMRDGAQNLARALQRLFDDCDNDAGCRGRFPGLRERFAQALSALNENPALLSLPDGSGVIEVSGDDFVLLLRVLLQKTPAIPQLPRLISALAEGDYDSAISPAIAEMLFNGEAAAQSEGVFLNLLCADEASDPGADSPSAQARAILDIVSPALERLTREFLDQCAEWGARGPPASSLSAAASGLPSLILSGAYDPVTPPAWGDRAQLPNSWQIVFPNLGHGTLFAEPCAQEIARHFLADPLRAPEHACHARSVPPAFALDESD